MNKVVTNGFLIEENILLLPFAPVKDLKKSLKTFQNLFKTWGIEITKVDPPHFIVSEIVSETARVGSSFLKGVKTMNATLVLDQIILCPP